jgi:hypothetical protein
MLPLVRLMTAAALLNCVYAVGSSISRIGR